MKKIIGYFMVLNMLGLFLLADNTEMLLKENGCFKCHNIVGIKKAPPFSMIAMRNSHWYTNSVEKIKNSIRNGSQGKYSMFFGFKMPAYKNISDHDLNLIANWILSQEKKGVHGCRMMMH